MIPTDTLDQSPLSPTVLLAAWVGCVVLLTLVGLFVRSRQRAARGERWLAGVYGAWTGLEDSATWERGRAERALRDEHSIENASDLAARLEELVRGRQTGNLAWDSGRAADALRMARAAGLMTDAEARVWAVRIADVLQQRYVSWLQYLTAFEAGMHAWQDRTGVQDPAERGRVRRNYPLLVQQVWPKAGFKTPFV